MAEFLLDIEMHLRALGAIFVVLAFVHGIFPRRFAWATELPRLSLINQQLMTVHTFFIAVVVFLIGIVCVTDAPELVGTPLGRHVCAGLAVFWGLRLYAQHFVYSSALWRGKTVETAVHIAFTLLWGWATAVFAWCAFNATP
jgi:hypothetical protein